MELNTYIPIQYQGIIPLAIGLLLCYIVGNRRFNRRGIGGMQHFRNYPLALLVTFIEWLCAFLGRISVLLGLFMLLMEWINGTIG